MRLLRLLLFPGFLLAGLACATVAQPDSDDPNVRVGPALLAGLDYRLVGPYRGGRVTAVTGIATQPYTFYMGSTGGGVWKTTDAGETWRNVTDGFLHAGSIGAVEVAPSDPNVVYVGTGSACPRGNVSPGDGVYRSTDAGRTWTHAGLPDAGLISRVRVHPNDPDLVYAAVLGDIFAPNPERGIYRSTDGGARWEQVLFVSDSTGAADLVLDPTNPRILYAAMWRAERKPWTLIDGAREGGLYKSTDGGDTWTRLDGGLPGGLIGRTGVAVSPADPDRVWAIQENAEVGRGGIFRSDDGGRHFTRINGERRFLQRAWYYNHIYADPKDPNTVYVLNVGFYKSTDGGRTFEQIAVPHADNHDLWINPRDPALMINANDGGANVSLNGGQTWSTQLNQPTAEFYRVTVDAQHPYRLYGAQQDNTTISVPSHSPGGITPEQYWYPVGGGESGHIAVDPRDPNIVYAGNYIGQITRLDRARGHIRDVVAYPQMHDGTAPRDIRYRFQWNAPIRLSPHDPDVLYHTSQYVHRSRDGGQTWATISPDLTTDNDRYHDLPGGPVQHDHTGVELYTTIFAFEVSPHTPGVLWAGTDDGRVHRSPDDGTTWVEVTPPAMPPEGTVNTIELSAHAPDRAFLAVYRYRDGDPRPYVFRTNDAGGSWTLLTDGANGIPVGHWVRVVREDPERRGLLYAGTEFGLYVSFDDGAHWQPFQLDLPVTPITDLQVHRGDLVVATQGRSFWILDDLSPLRQLTDAVAAADAHLFVPRTAVRRQGGGFRGGTAPEPAPDGATIYFALAEAPDSSETVRLDLLDAEGLHVRTFSTRPDTLQREGRLEAGAGLNRFVWDLRYPEARLLDDAVMSLADTDGPAAAPGAYQVRLRAGDTVQTRAFRVEKDPRWTVTDEDLQAQFDLAQTVLEKLDETHDAIRRIRAVRMQTGDIADRAVRAGHDDTLRTAARMLADTLTAIEQELIQTRNESRQDPINFPPRLDDQLAYLYSIVNGQDARPTAGAYERFADLEAEVQPHLDALASVLATDLPAFYALLDQEGVSRVIVPTR